MRFAVLTVLQEVHGAFGNVLIDDHGEEIPLFPGHKSRLQLMEIVGNLGVAVLTVLAGGNHTAATLAGQLNGRTRRDFDALVPQPLHNLLVGNSEHLPELGFRGSRIGPQVVLHFAKQGLLILTTVWTKAVFVQQIFKYFSTLGT